MNANSVTPKYAVLHYDVQKKLNISWTEYIYLDMIYHLSYDGWCIKSLENCAKDLGVTKRGLIKIKNRLQERGLIRKNPHGHLKVTRQYVDVAVNSVHRTPNMVVNKVPKPVNSVHSVGELSSPKNNNRNTLDLEISKKNQKGPVSKNDPGYMSARARIRFIKEKPGVPFDQWFRKNYQLNLVAEG